MIDIKNLLAFILRIKWRAKGVANAEKIADGIKTGSRIIGNAGALFQSGGQALESAGNLYDSYVKDGEIISWKNATDLITLGLSVAGMGMAGKSLAKDGKALKAVSQGNVNVKPATVSNRTIIDPPYKMDLQKFAKNGGNKNIINSTKNNPDFIVTPEGVVMPTNRDFNLVSTTVPTNKGGEFLQIHTQHLHKKLTNPHTHKPQFNVDHATGIESSKRLDAETSVDDINYADKVLRNGKLRIRSNRKDKGGY